VDDGGGAELIASQDEPHGEEPAIAHAPADDEEEQGLGEWAAEEENEEHEEDEQVLATEASGPEGSNERVSADSDEEFPVLLASDGEEDNERSEQRLGCCCVRALFLIRRRLRLEKPFETRRPMWGERTGVNIRNKCNQAPC
jgi:hypothetical protein